MQCALFWRRLACCRKKGQPLIGVLMADSRHSLWDASSERHLLFRHVDGRREGMYLLPTAINLVYALQQGYDFIHFQVRPQWHPVHSMTRKSLPDAQQLTFHSSSGPLLVKMERRGMTRM